MVKNYNDITAEPLERYQEAYFVPQDSIVWMIKSPFKGGEWVIFTVYTEHALSSIS